MLLISGAMLARSNLKNTIITKNKILVFRVRPKPRGTPSRSALQHLMGPKMEPTIDQVAPKWLRLKFMAVASLRSETDVDAFWLPCGSLLVPSWFQLAPFCLTFGIIFYVLPCSYHRPLNRALRNMAPTRRLN